MPTKQFLENFTPTLRRGLLTEGYDYSCLMAIPDGDISPILERYQSIVLPQDIFTEEGGGKGLETEHHITILYGILDKNPDKVKSLVREQRQFRVTLRDISLFENERYDVLKVDVESDTLVRLNRLITRNVEYHSNFPEYHPHMTLAYIRRGAGKRYTGKYLDGVELHISHLKFSSSNGEKTDIPLLEP